VGRRVGAGLNEEKSVEVKWVAKTLKRADQALPFLQVPIEQCPGNYTPHQHRVDHMITPLLALISVAVNRWRVSTFYTVSASIRQ